MCLFLANQASMHIIVVNCDVNNHNWRHSGQISLTLYNVVIRKIPDHFSLYADPIMVFKTFTPLLWELRQPSQFILYGVVDAVYDWYPEKNKQWHLF